MKRPDDFSYGTVIGLTRDGQTRSRTGMTLEFCAHVRNVCQAQREGLAFQKVALRLRRDWHSMPRSIKSNYYLQLAVDRRVRELIESAEQWKDSQ